MNNTTLSFGGGKDSSTIAAIDLNRPLAAELLGISLDELNQAVPQFNEIVFADTGAESAATYANVQRFKAAFEAAGKTFHIVRIQDVSKAQDATITDWMLRLGIVPVMAGGSHICSKKFKGDVIAKALGHREFIIGIEANEGRRLVFTPPKGGSTFRYPLVELGLGREDLDELLEKLGFAGVEKSSCVFCPFKSEEELRDMWANDRAAWELCLEVEENFRLTSSVKFNAWIEAGRPLTKRGSAPVGMWRKDSWAEGRRLFVKKIDGRQLSVEEWGERFAAEEASLIPVVEVA